MKEDRKTWQIHAILTIVLIVSPDVGDRSVNAFWQYSGSRKVIGSKGLTSARIHVSILYYRPPTKLREGNVFTRVCVCLSNMGRGGPMWPIFIMHWTSMYSPPSRHGTSLDRDPQPPLGTSGGNHWIPVQTCSLQGISSSGAAIWWLLKLVRSVQWVVCILLECFIVWELFLDEPIYAFLVTFILFIL